MPYDANQGQPELRYVSYPQRADQQGQSGGGHAYPAGQYSQSGYAPSGYAPPQYAQNPMGQPPYAGPAGYGYQPNAGQMYQAPGSANRWGPTSFGMDANVAAGLGYLISILGVIFFFMEKSNRFVKFHAAQVTLLTLATFAAVVVEVVLFVAFASLAAATDSGIIALLSTLSTCIFGLAYLGLVGVWIWGMIAAFSGKYVKLPVIGAIAERWAGGAPIPAY